MRGRRRARRPGRRARRSARGRWPSCPRRCAGWCCAGSAESLLGQAAPALAREADEIVAPAEAAARKSLDLGGGLRAVAEYGTLRFTVARGRRAARAGGPVRARPGTLRRLGGGGPARAPAARSASPPTALGGRALVRSLARRRPHAPGSASAAPRRSRTCSPTEKIPRALRRPCRWSRWRARSCGWRGGARRALRGRRPEDPRRGGPQPPARCGEPSPHAGRGLHSRRMHDAGDRRDPGRARGAGRRACVELAEEISRDYEGRDLLLVGRAEGRRLLPLGPDAPPRPRVRGGLHGRVLLRLLDRLLGRRPHPQGPRRRRSRAATC